MKTLPILPLDLVFFPRQSLPLRIFEPRYKQLIDDCMINDGQFGICLTEPNNTIRGWEAPKYIGTIAKIVQCKDVDWIQLQIETIGRSKFRIVEIIPPAFEQPRNYDPYTLEGHKAISILHERVGVKEKMYIRAKVKMIPEIDEPVSIFVWEELIKMWKEKIIKLASPKTINPHSLDHMLEHYYLITDTPSVEYIYSLSALGVQKPGELQPILEANTMTHLIQRVKQLMTIK